MFLPAHRRIQRGVTLIECVVLLGMVLIVAAAGVRVAGKRIDAMAAPAGGLHRHLEQRGVLALGRWIERPRRRGQRARFRTQIGRG